MLDRIPLGSAGRVVRDGGRDPEGIAQLVLNLGFPAPGSATVAATRVGQNQNVGSPAVPARSLPFPPSGDGTRREGWRRR